MPRYAYQTPRARVYSYNYGYMNNYYKPMTHYVEKGDRAVSEQPGHQSLAERLKTFPMDGSTYHERAMSVPPPLRTRPTEEDPERTRRSLSPAPLDPTLPRESAYPLMLKSEVTPKKEHRPLWMKHPYRLPIEDVHTAPHESSVWPEKVPHFNLVSSYDLMCGYLGLNEPRTIEI